MRRRVVLAAVVACVLAGGCGALGRIRLPGGQAGLRAEIRVDVDAAIRRIPRSLYGTNLEWIQDGNGLWDRQQNAPNPEIVGLTRDLNVSLIRFPGGVFGDFYHWRDGVGPQHSRPETEHRPQGAVSRHTFGTDEALEFARRVGAQLLISVNAGTGTAEEAAAWVRYVNGGADQARRQRVQYWEVGNELYINDGGPASAATTVPPETYARRFLEFAGAMRKADPTISIGAVGGENYGRYNPVSYADWNRTVLTAAAQEIDFLAVHNAYAPMLVTESWRSVRGVYAAMLAAPVLIGRNLQTLSDQIEQFAPARADQIKIAVTEWGPLFHVRPDNRYVDHVKTLGSALFAASAFKEFLESPRTEIANFFKLVGPTFMGWIGPREGSYVPKAPYLALQMYSSHFGSVLVGSSVKCPAYDTPPIGLMAGVENVPYLDVVASRSGDGLKVYIMAVNKHLDSPIRARITLKGFGPAPEGVAWTLNGSGIDANTGTELAEAPGVTWATQAEAEPDPRFSAGGPGEVGISVSKVAGVAETFSYTFPAHSVTSLELRRSD